MALTRSCRWSKMHNQPRKFLKNFESCALRSISNIPIVPCIIFYFSLEKNIFFCLDFLQKSTGSTRLIHALFFKLYLILKISNYFFILVKWWLYIDVTLIVWNGRRLRHLRFGGGIQKATIPTVFYFMHYTVHSLARTVGCRCLEFRSCGLGCTIYGVRFRG